MPNQVGPPRRHHRRGASPETKQSKTQPRPRLGRRGSVIHVLMSARTTGAELPYARSPATTPPPPPARGPRTEHVPHSPAVHLAPRARGVHGGDAKPASAEVKTDCLRWSPRHNTKTIRDRVRWCRLSSCELPTQVRILHSARPTSGAKICFCLPYLKVGAKFHGSRSEGSIVHRACLLAVETMPGSFMSR